MKIHLKKLLFLILSLTLVSCRYFNSSPVNGITIIDLKDKPSTIEMVGNWEVDKFSNDLIQQKGYESKKVELELKNDGTFEVKNLPNFINVFDETSEKYVTTNGNWEIRKNFKGDKWVLNMSFEESSLYQNGMTTDYDLYLLEDNIIIWTYIGDPDSGERFLYAKK